MQLGSRVCTPVRTLSSMDEHAVAVGCERPTIPPFSGRPSADLGVETTRRKSC